MLHSSPNGYIHVRPFPTTSLSQLPLHIKKEQQPTKGFPHRIVPTLALVACYLQKHTTQTANPPPLVAPTPKDQGGTNSYATWLSNVVCVGRQCSAYFYSSVLFGFSLSASSTFWEGREWACWVVLLVHEAGLEGLSLSGLLKSPHVLCAMTFCHIS